MTITTDGTAPGVGAVKADREANTSMSTATYRTHNADASYMSTCYRNLFSRNGYTQSRATAGVLTSDHGRPGVVAGAPGIRLGRGRVCLAPDRGGRPVHPGRPDSGRGCGPDSGAAPAARPEGRLAPRLRTRPGTRLAGAAPALGPIREAIPSAFPEFVPELPGMASYFSREFTGNAITGVIAGCRTANPGREGACRPSGGVVGRGRPAARPASRRGVSWL